MDEIELSYRLKTKRVDWLVLIYQRVYSEYIMIYMGDVALYTYILSSFYMFITIYIIYLYYLYFLRIAE